jgi:hypothetical protein
MRMDEEDGFYLNAGLALVRRNFPLSFSSMVNTTIRSNVSVGEDLLWNVSLNYTIR